MRVLAEQHEDLRPDTLFLDIDAGTCNSNTGGAEVGGFLGLAAPVPTKRASSRVSERPCFKGINKRVLKQNT